MALIDSGQLDALAEDIVPAAPADASAEQIAARNASVASVRDMAEKILQYVVDNIEINGVTVDTGSLLTPPPVVTAMDGGLTLFGSTLIPSINLQTLTQNNDGTGRVS